MLKIKKNWLIVPLMLLAVMGDNPLLAERFEEYEIRVIRPRYFSKKNRFELGAQFNVITNQSFVYTYMGSGALSYHFNNKFAFEVAGTYGFSVPKDDKRILESSDFDIKTSIIRTKYMLSGSLLWTPIYGKYQLTSGRLIYFDTFLAAGVGMTGVEYLYDHCADPSTAAPGVEFPTPPDPTVVSYPTFNFGIGQRFFISRKTSIRWDMRPHFFSYDTADGSCDPDVESGSTNSHQNVTLQMGVSRFF